MTVHFNSCENEMYSLFKNELFQLHMNPLWLISIVLVTNCTTLVLGVKCVLFHTMLVTYTLMSVLVDVKEIFRRLKVPYNKYRRFIFVLGFVHLINPLLLIFEHEYIIYVHFVMCFLLHLFHTHYIVLVFRNMKYIDKYYYKILILLNVCEVFSNLCLICVYKDSYEHCAIITESICACIFTYKRRQQTPARTKCSIVHCCDKF
jgi:hypothetical protein